MFVFLSIATLMLFVATLLPLWRHPHWVIRSMDFPRQQLATLALILLLLQLTFLDFGGTSAWGLVSVALFCLGWHLWWIAPYTRLWPVEVETACDYDLDRSLSIITANVLRPNRNAQDLLALVEQHRPDVLVTLESDQWWQTQLDILASDMPHTIKCPLDNLYGMHVYSCLPLDEAELAFLVDEDVPSMHCRLRLRSGNHLRIHFLHPAPPSPTESPTSAERDAELVIVARSVADSDQPLIVTGDLNDVAWSSTTRLFRKISGLLDPRVGRGLFNTFRADYPFLRWPLEHIFHSRHFLLHSIQRLPSIGSDHFPLLARLMYSPTGGGGQGGLTDDSGDRARARSIADNKNVNENGVPHPGEK